jgi:hypothetical protein
MTGKVFKNVFEKVIFSNKKILKLQLNKTFALKRQIIAKEITITKLRNRVS